MWHINVKMMVILSNVILWIKYLLIVYAMSAGPAFGPYFYQRPEKISKCGTPTGNVKPSVIYLCWKTFDKNQLGIQ